jgi:hypothetical protein
MLRKRYGRAHMCRSGSTPQTLLFPRDRFTVAGAKAWAKKHHWRSDDVDLKADFIHLRQEDPRDFRRIRTVHFGGSGVQARVGWKKC